MVDFDAVLKRFTDAVEANDGEKLGALFTEDGPITTTFTDRSRGVVRLRTC